MKIPYTIKESPRAKHIRLQISPTEGVIVVAPKGCKRSQIDTLVQQRQAWIEKHLNKFKTKKQQKHPRTVDFPPKSLNLRAINQTWHFTYQKSATNRYKSFVPGEMLVEGDLNDDSLKVFFHQWLSQQAVLHLVPKLAEISKLAGLPYEKATVKCQKTRWGSCSNRGNINLNYKLLFLPSQIARYVLIHELSHTKHLNHSAEFWRLVEKFEPDYRRLDKALNDGWCYVPEWV
jgi:predicted metal-dependent hydrolase